MAAAAMDDSSRETVDAWDHIKLKKAVETLTRDNSAIYFKDKLPEGILDPITRQEYVKTIDTPSEKTA